MASILSSSRKTKLSSRGGLGGDVPAPGFFAGQGASLQPGDPRDIFAAVAKFQGIGKERQAFPTEKRGLRKRIPRNKELDRKREALRQSVGGFRGDDTILGRGRGLGGGLGGGLTRLG